MPATVVISNGLASATVPITTIDDGVTDGSQTVTITAATPGLASGSDTLVVTDGNLPDLVVAWVEAPTNALTEAYFSFSFRVENRGLAPSSNGILQKVYLSSDPYVGGDMPLMVVDFDGGITNGGFFEETLSSRLPKIPGDYWVVLATDAEDAVFELREDNNVAISAAPTLPINVTASDAILQDGASQDFGNVELAATTNVVFTITNLGTTWLSNLAVTLDGLNSSDFTLVAGPWAMMAPGESSTVSIQFRPTALGARTASLHLANDDLAHRPYDITLTGLGVDTLAPSITCPSDVTVSTDPGQCLANITNLALGWPTASDNSGSVIARSNAPAQFPVGTTVVTWTATDPSGNTNFCTQLVVVRDTEPPWITCPPDIMACADPGRSWKTNVTWKAKGNDNCGLSNLVCVPPSDSTFLVGAQTVVCTATDASGNSQTCSFAVAIQTQPPVPGAIVAWGANTVGQTNAPPDLTNVIAVAAGYDHNLALQADGQVVAWGGNDSGQTNVPPGMPVLSAIAAGWGTSFGLTSQSNVVEWGRSTAAVTNYFPSGLDGVTFMAGGYDHALAIRQGGHLVAFGSNYQGEGVIPIDLANVAVGAVGAGQYHSIELKTDGTVVAWGGNGAWTNVPPGLSNAVAVAAGGYHCLALKEDGTVFAWGNNSDGQTNVPADLLGVVAVSAGDRHSMALKADGTVVTWGRTNEGQCNIPAGMSNVVAIAAGGNHRLALVEPLSLQVTGRVSLEGYTGWAQDGQGYRTVAFKATDEAGTVLASWNFPLNFVLGADGYGVADFTLKNVPPGTTHLSAKTAWHLRKRLPVMFAGRFAVADFREFRRLSAGDLDGSNGVDLGDYHILAGAWYQPDPSADIDGNNLVDLDDYFLLSNHWLEQGDPE